jgi:MazG family protein
MSAIDGLLEIMARLRDPEGGCPWDLKQTYATIVPHTIEEAYEVADAIDRADFEELRDELGDLLFQVVFYSQIAKEEGRFDFGQVAGAVSDKIVRRHPHVFGDARFESDEAFAAAWELTKAEERKEKAVPDAAHSAMDGVALALPALARADKLQRRAARVGFDWPETGPVLDKIHEEIEELRVEIERDDVHQRIEEELGDLLFAVVNLARHLRVGSEEALRQANRKFEQRFRWIEQALEAEGRRPEDCSLEELDGLWEKAKGC